MRKNPGTPGPLGLFYKPLWDLMISCKYPFVRCLDGPVCLICLGQGCGWPGGQGPGDHAAEACRTKHTGLSLPSRLGVWGQNWVTSQLCAPSTQPDPGWCCIHAYVRIRFFFPLLLFFNLWFSSHWFLMWRETQAAVLPGPAFSTRRESRPEQAPFPCFAVALQLGPPALECKSHPFPHPF